MDNGENIHVISEQEDRALAAIVRSVPDIIYRLDEQGYIVYISAAVRRYGYEPEELIGRNIFDLVHPDDREKATYKVNERRRGERGTRLLEVRLMTKDHEAVDFELSADAWPTFLVNAEGIYDPAESNGDRFLYTQGVARDISERAQAQADDHLIPAQETAMRAAGMVRQLMLFAHKGLPLDLYQQLHETVAIARQTFDRRIRIVEEAAEGLVVRADAGQLQQVLMDLLLNARDALAGRDDPTIHVRWSQVDAGTMAAGEPCARIEVEDNGVGMDGYTRERIFDPFFTTKPVDEGTGLGLSTVYGIVQQHGGRIECHSEEGRGATFAVYLPLELTSRVDAETAAESTGPARSGGTILVVDDEEVVRESTRKLLEHSGFRVLVAEGGEAVELARREAVDLVLLDLSMPDISGPEVLAALRRDGIAARVVFFTGYLAAADQYAGVDGVLQKPFTADELMDLVHQMLDD